MNWKKYTFKFSNFDVLSNVKSKLDKMDDKYSYLEVNFPTCTPYHLQLTLEEKENQSFSTSDIFSQLRKEADVVCVTDLLQTKNDGIVSKYILDCDGEEYSKYKKRGISILLENATKEDIEKIKNFCDKNILYFSFRYAKSKSRSYIDINDMDVVPLYYFWIRSDTQGYEKLNQYMDNRLVLTDYAEFGNIADRDDVFMEEFIYLVRDCKELQDKEIKTNNRICQFIKKIDDVDTLKAFMKYSCYLTDFQKKLVQNRIDVLNNERYHFSEEMLETIKSLDCDVAKLREKTGMNRKEFAAYFEIPYRTVEDWENKKSTCSSYLFKLMEYRISNEF